MTHRFLLAMTTCLFVVASSAHAIEFDSSNLQGSGTASLERLPTILRMQIDLVAKKPTLEEALKAIGERREAVKAALPTLGPAPLSTHFDDPKIATGAEMLANHAQLLERMGRTKRGQKAAAPTLPITATAQLTVDWPLDATSAEDLIKASHALQTRIREADLGGAKEAAAKTPEEEELAAEMENMHSYSNEPPRTPGEPRFLFVAKIDPKEKARLTAEAFEAAKKDAAELAAAAGGSLGRVGTIHRAAGSTPLGDDYSGWHSYGRMAHGMPFGVSPSPGSAGSSKDEEALGAAPAKVTYSVYVNASFEIVSPDK